MMVEGIVPKCQVYQTGLCQESLRLMWLDAPRRKSPKSPRRGASSHIKHTASAMKVRLSAETYLGRFCSNAITEYHGLECLAPVN